MLEKGLSVHFGNGGIMCLATSWGRSRENNKNADWEATIHWHCLCFCGMLKAEAK